MGMLVNMYVYIFLGGGGGVFFVVFIFVCFVLGFFCCLGFFVYVCVNLYMCINECACMSTQVCIKCVCMYCMTTYSAVRILLVLN